MALFIDILSWVFLLAGAFFMVVGGIGLLRLPDFYCRIHAAGMTDTMGSWLILIGLMLQAGWTLVTLKLLLVLFFLVATSPLASHALAKAAWLHGLDPLVGPQKGERR
jgi:multicomponent Na+:H+ antiporter subunit G